MAFSTTTDLDLRPDELRIFFDTIDQVENRRLVDFVMEMQAVARAATKGHYGLYIDQIIEGSEDFRFRLKPLRPRRKRMHSTADETNFAKAGNIASVASAVFSAMTLYFAANAGSAGQTIINNYGGTVVNVQTRDQSTAIPVEDLGKADGGIKFRRAPWTGDRSAAAEAVRVARAAPNSEWLVLAGKVDSSGKFRTIYGNTYEIAGAPVVPRGEIILIEAEIKLNANQQPSFLIHNVSLTDHR